MAVQEQSQNQILEVWGILRRRVWQIVLPAAVVLALGSALAKLMPKKYTAMTGLELRESTLPITGQGLDEKTIQRDVTSTPWQVVQFERVARVIEKLEWPEYTALSPLQQFDFVRTQIKNINVGVKSAKNLQGSSEIKISYTCDDPQRAEQFLNRLREAYISEVLERYRNDAKRSLEVLRNQMTIAGDKAHDRLEEASTFKKDYGMSATQQAPGGGRQRDEDPVYSRLSQAQVRLMEVDAQIASDTAGLETLQKQYKEEPSEVPESITAGGRSYDDEIEKIEKEIADQRESQAGVKELNSRYMLAESRIRKLQQKKATLVEKATGPAEQTSLRPNPRREQLQTAIQQKELALKQAAGLKAQLEASVGELKQDHAARVEVFRQIQQLDSESLIAEENYQRASAAFARQQNFVDLISESYVNPFEVTELARAPTSPTSLSSTVVAGIAGVLGMALGLVWALLSEFGRNGFRGVADTTRGLAIPVLGVINQIRTSRERRAIQLRRAVVGLSTFALVASIFWISWAFEHRPQVLGHDIVRALTDVKEALR